MMDVSTSLVQAYLHVNGYFTATEYPLVESRRNRAPRPVTDIDMLAVRFGRTETPATKPRSNRKTISGPVTRHPDTALGGSSNRTDMVVAEIKQGRAQVNPAARDKNALAAALMRFGCCSQSDAPSLVHALLQHGRAQGERGHVVRMVLFASQGERAPRGWHWVHLDHVFRFLDEYLRVERGVLGMVNLHDPALAWLSLMHKCQLSFSASGSPG